MKTISTIALIAALSFSVPAFAQVAVDTSASVGVSTSVEAGTSGVSVEAGTSAEVSASASAAAGTDTSSSSMSSAAASSSMSDGAMGASMTCDTLNSSLIATAMLDKDALAAATSVTVFSITDCSGLADLAAANGEAQAALGADPKVAEAITASGNVGAEIVGYTLADGALTVYVRSR